MLKCACVCIANKVFPFPTLTRESAVGPIHKNMAFPAPDKLQVVPVVISVEERSAILKQQRAKHDMAELRKQRTQALREMDNAHKKLHTVNNKIADLEPIFESLTDDRKRIYAHVDYVQKKYLAAAVEADTAVEEAPLPVDAAGTSAAISKRARCSWRSSCCGSCEQCGHRCGS